MSNDPNRIFENTGLSPEYQRIAQNLAAEVRGLKWWFSQPEEERISMSQQLFLGVSEGVSAIREQAAIGVDIQVPGEEFAQEIGGVFSNSLSVSATIINRGADVATRLAGALQSGPQAWTNISEQDAQDIALRYARALQDHERNQSPLSNGGGWFYNNVLIYLHAALNWAMNGFEGDYNATLANLQNLAQTDNAVDVVRDRGEFTRQVLPDVIREVVPELSQSTLPEDLAHAQSGVDVNGQFHRVPFFIDPNDAHAISMIEAEIAEENPNISHYLNGVTSAGAVPIAASTAIAAVAARTFGPPAIATLTPPVRWAGQLLTGAAEGTPILSRYVREASDRRFSALVEDAVSLEERRLRFESGVRGDEYRAFRNGVHPERARQFARETMEALPTRSISRIRLAGRKLPLIGTIFAGAFILDSLDRVSEAEESEVLTPEQANELRALLSLDLISSAGGFLADPAVEGLRGWWLEDPEKRALYEEYLPETLTALIMNAVENDATLTTIQAAHENLNSRVPYYDVQHMVESASDEIYNRPISVESFARLQHLYLAYQHAHPQLENPYEFTIRQIVESSRDFSYLAADADTFIQQLNSSGEVQLPHFDINLSSPIAYITEAQLFYDLYHEGPIYQRLLNSALAAGIDMQRFEQNVLVTLGAIASNYQALDRNDPVGVINSRMALINPDYFGLDNPVVAPVTEAEAERYLHVNAGEGVGAVEQVYNIVLEDYQELGRILQHYHANYFEETLQHEGAGYVSIQQLHAAFNRQNQESVFRSWLNPQDDYAMLVGLINDFYTAASDELVLVRDLNDPRLREMLDRYEEYVRYEGFSAYRTQRDGILERAYELDEKSHGLLIVSSTESEVIAEAVRLAFMLPEPASIAENVTNPSDRAMMEAAKVFREALNAGEDIYEPLSHFMRIVGGEGIAHHEPQQQATMLAPVGLSDDELRVMLASIGELPPTRLETTGPVQNVSLQGTLEVADVEESPRQFRPTEVARAVHADHITVGSA